VVVAGIGLVSFALLQNFRAFPGEHGADRRQAFICATFCLIRGDNITEGPDQTVRPFLKLEVMQCQGFFSAAMNAHHPFDEHLAEVITDPRQLGLKKYRRKCVAFMGLQFLHSRSIQALRLGFKLVRLGSRKASKDACRGLLIGQPLVMVHQFLQMRQRRTAGILFERVPGGSSGLCSRFCPETINPPTAILTKGVEDLSVECAIDFSTSKPRAHTG
jgi:hypothetical protein